MGDNQQIFNKEDYANLQNDGVPITCQEVLLETEPNVSEFLAIENLNNKNEIISSEEYKDSSPPSLIMEIGNSSNIKHI